MEQVLWCFKTTSGLSLGDSWLKFTLNESDLDSILPWLWDQLRDSNASQGTGCGNCFQSERCLGISLKLLEEILVIQTNLVPRWLSLLPVNNQINVVVWSPNLILSLGLHRGCLTDMNFRPALFYKEEGIKKGKLPRSLFPCSGHLCLTQLLTGQLPK